MNASIFSFFGLAALCLLSGISCTTKTVYLPHEHRVITTERRVESNDLAPRYGATYSASPRGEYYGGTIVEGAGSYDAPENTRFISEE